MTMILVCPEHGDLYRQVGAKPGDPHDLSRIERLDDRAPEPVSGMVIRCHCKRELFTHYEADDE